MTQEKTHTSDEGATALALLLGSCSFALVILWSIGQVNDRTWLTNLPGWLTAGYGALWAGGVSTFVNGIVALYQAKKAGRGRSADYYLIRVGLITALLLMVALTGARLVPLPRPVPCGLATAIDSALYYQKALTKSAYSAAYHRSNKPKWDQDIEGYRKLEPKAADAERELKLRLAGPARVDSACS
jgi:hypothetical protein